MKMIIGGEKVDASDGKIIEVYDPATKELLGSVPSASMDDVQKVLENAREGAKIWSQVHLHERARILTRFAHVAQEHKTEIARMLSRQMGKIIGEAEWEVDSVTNLFKGYSEKALHMLAHSMPIGAEGGTESDIMFTKREPLGVVLCIVPFNFPCDLFAHKVAPALIAGNAVIVRPSRQNPMDCIRLVELLIECGVPGKAIQIVTGDRETGTALISSPMIDAVSFTGSTAVGIKLSQAAAANLTRVFLELGGNDPFIVFEDADIDRAVEESVASRILNVGQTCCATKRFIVQNSVKEEYTEKLIAALGKLKMGDPLDPEITLGCLISEKAAAQVVEDIDKTIAQGAKCPLRGEITDGTYMGPTVLTDVTSEMDIAVDMEVFGPVFPIIGFDTLEEAVEIANKSMYGLSGGVMSGDVRKEMKVASQMQCGGVVTNGSGLYRTPTMPFGGFKMSGAAREGISATLEEMTQSKAYVIKGALA
ncbi:MAG: aldehyde dehydrogenase family protein [Kiritimatiellia bacterium]|jgi:succinate-semialdehyde dehydrogenase/glutarate-semialdehyde dehydrogenase|nr:aldehyde dehydrogenase family protein [Kiritimatiellia bacterium]